MIGSILFNGNVEKEEDFIYQFKERILESNHVDPEVRKNKKVLLITGAWSDQEFNEGHVKSALRDIGINSDYKEGFDKNIQNLSVYHAWQKFHDSNPKISSIYEKTMEKLFQIKHFYQERNEVLMSLLQRHAGVLKHEFEGLSLSDILGYSVEDHNWRVPQMDDKELLKHYSCQEIQKTLDFLKNGDELQAKTSSEIQEYAKIKSGILANYEYQEMRKKLIDRILSSNSIFIFGGRVDSLYYSVKFWELQHALEEALLRGTNFYTVSAGSIILCQKIILYNDFPDSSEQKRHFEFFDHGLGIVSKIKLFPHCRDRIQTDDPDNLAFLAHRFEGRVCVGLNEHSFLLMDAEKDGQGRLYPRYTSLGEKDGVYVFDPSGNKIVLNKGEELMVPGTLVWEKNHPHSQAQEKDFQVDYTGKTLWPAIDKK